MASNRIQLEDYKDISEMFCYDQIGDPKPSEILLKASHSDHDYFNFQLENQHSILLSKGVVHNYHSDIVIASSATIRGLKQKLENDKKDAELKVRVLNEAIESLKNNINEEQDNETSQN